MGYFPQVHAYFPKFPNSLAIWENLYWAISIVRLWVAKEYHILTHR